MLIKGSGRTHYRGDETQSGREDLETSNGYGGVPKAEEQLTVLKHAVGMEPPTPQERGQEEVCTETRRDLARLSIVIRVPWRLQHGCLNCTRTDHCWATFPYRQ